MAEAPLAANSELNVPPTKATTPAPYTSAALVEANRQEFAELVTFIDFAEGLTIGFVEVNQERDRSLLAEALRQHLANTDTHLEVINFSRQPDLRYLLDALQQRLTSLKAASPNGNKKLVLFIQGLEVAIGTDGVGAYPPMLQDLNFVRDAYRERVPHPLLFVLPDYALTRISQYAPDFWAWQSGVFRFKTPLQTVEQLKADMADHPLPRIASTDNQEQIEQIKQLLMELSPSGKPIAPSDLPQCCDLYYKIGSAYYTQKQPAKARDYLQEGLKLLSHHPNPTLERDFHRKLGNAYEDLRQFDAAIAEYTTALDIAKTQNQSESISTLLHDLGDVALQQRQFDRANAFYEQSLELNEASNNRYGQASTLHQMGRVAQEQRQFEQALQYYQQALDITIEFGDRYEQAGTLHNMGWVAQEQRQFEQAQQYYQQALDIYIEFGDRYGQASTLHNMGVVAQEQRQFEQAQQYFQQALDIYIEFGDRYAQASTLHNMGMVAQEQRQFEQAQQYFQQALDIKIEFGDRYEQAGTLHQMGIVAQELRQFEQALQYYQQALDIKIEFGDRYEQAGTYFQLGKVAEETGDLDKATTCYLEDLRITVEFNDEHGLGISLRNLARFYQATQDKTLLTEAAQILNTPPDELRQLFSSSNGSDEQ